MTDAEEFAVLCRKPFNLTMEQYLALDDWQIVNVYFRPPTGESAKRGYYWPMPSRDREQDLRLTRYVYYREGRRNGIDEKIIKRGWREYKIVLLYGIEGSPVPLDWAARKVMLERGDDPQEVKQKVREMKRNWASRREEAGAE